MAGDEAPKYIAPLIVGFSVKWRSNFEVLAGRAHKPDQGNTRWSANEDAVADQDNPNKHFESNGPDVKIRGSAQQILDKYLQYARDAQTSGDRVNAENYLQHAEHYLRLIATMQPKDKPRDQQEQKSAEDADANAENSEQNGEKDANSNKSQRNGSDREDRGRRRGRSNRNRNDQAEEGKTEDNGDAQAASAEVSGDAVEAASDAAAEAPAPKPRRRTTRKPKPAVSEAGEADDGIMKTLSRGRKPKAESVPDDAAAPTPEAAD